MKIYIIFFSSIVLLFAPLFGASGIFFPETQEQWQIILSLRVPRVLLGFIVGSGLALCGAILQSFFRNELASPYTLGVASTASFGAVVALFFRLPGVWIELFAILFSLLSLFMMLRVYKTGRLTDLSTLLLVGLAFGLLSSSGIYFLQYLGGVERSFEIYRWLAGGLEITDFSSVLLPFIVLSVCGFFVYKNVSSLDLIQVGSEFAKGRGVDISKITTLVIWTTAMITGVFVAVCGPIGFIGLIIPHVSRRFVGGGHRELLPLSMLLGGVFLVLMDAVSRVLFSPLEIPVGILCSLLGGPCFLWMLLKRKVSVQ